MDQIFPHEIFQKICNYCDIKTIFDIRTVSKLVNKCFLMKCRTIDDITIQSEFLEDGHVLSFGDVQLNISNFDILLYFSNVKKVSYGTYISGYQPINELVNCIPSTVESLTLRSDNTTLDWNLLSKFSKLTHLHIDAHMFYIVHDDDPSDEDVAVTYEYVDGTMDDSRDKLLNILKNTKVYYIEIFGFYHVSGWPSSTGVFIIRDKCPTDLNVDEWVDDMRSEAGRNRNFIEHSII